MCQTQYPFTYPGTSTVPPSHSTPASRLITYSCVFPSSLPAQTVAPYRGRSWVEVSRASWCWPYMSEYILSGCVFPLQLLLEIERYKQSCEAKISAYRISFLIPPWPHPPNNRHTPKLNAGFGKRFLPISHFMPFIEKKIFLMCCLPWIKREFKSNWQNS